MKFLESYYNVETGFSEVWIQHLGIKFRGISRLHPDEKEKGSSFAGCQIAELKAQIKALKYERKLAKQKSDMAIDFVKSCEGYKYFNKEDNTAKVMYRQLNRRIDKVNKLTDEINSLYTQIDNIIRNRNIILNAIERHKAKKVK